MIIEAVELSTGWYETSEILPFGPPSHTGGRWAKISPLSTPLWITPAEAADLLKSVDFIDAFPYPMVNIAREERSMRMPDEFCQHYQSCLDGVYDCVDRIVLNAYFYLAQSEGGFRTW